jgi:hypothetical protein
VVDFASLQHTVLEMPFHAPPSGGASIFAARQSMYRFFRRYGRRPVSRIRKQSLLFFKPAWRLRLPGGGMSLAIVRTSANKRQTSIAPGIGPPENGSGCRHRLRLQHGGFFFVPVVLRVKKN